MRSKPHQARLTAWLLAAVLLWVSAVAVAHELDHALDHHHDLCALHNYAGHHGGLPAPGMHPPAPPTIEQPDSPLSHPFIFLSRPAPYAVRAPPSV